MLPDRIFYDSDCYRSKGSPIELIDHNCHAWGINEGDFPCRKQVRYYTGEMFTWIKNNYKDPVNVWLFSSEGDKYDQFVTARGEVYREESLQRFMEEFTRKYTNDESTVEKITQQSFTTSSIAAQFARERNSWRPTKKKFIADVKLSCVEYGHGGLWNTEYDFTKMMSVDMIACYPGSFLGGGECGGYFKQFGLPTHRMVRRSVNGPLPDYTLTGFAEVVSFKLVDGLHPVAYIWIGRHLHEKRWCPTVLLRWMLDSGVITNLIVSEILFSCDKQTDIWLPTPEEFPRYEVEFLRDVITSECKALGRIIIGKFTQGESGEDETRKRKTAKLILDPGKLKFVIDDAVSKGVFVRQTAAKLSTGESFGTIVEYFSDEMPQYVHLRSYMLAYVTINLLSAVNRFPDIAVRVATDSFYYDRKYHDDVKKYLGNGNTWGTWRVKNEELDVYREHAGVADKPEFHCDAIEKISTSPSIHDPIARHKLVYLNGPGGCGKTTRVTELFRGGNLIALTPTHRLAKDFREKGINTSTYHSFFRYRGGLWTPDRMGTKLIPDVVVWDEICTVSKKKTIKMFLDWLNTKDVVVVLCGDHGQPPPFGNLSPHCWLKTHVDYYEEMTIDRRSLDGELTALKAAIRCTSSKYQGEKLREVIPATSLEEFLNNWSPSDMVVSSRKATRDAIMKKMFSIHESKFPCELVPLCYRPKDTRRQNINVDIPGRDERQELVLNDIVEVDLSVVAGALSATDSPWRLGYAATIHSSQGLTIADTIMYIIDDFIEWDNLIYLAVSRVRRITQLKRVAVTLKNLLC